MPRSKRERKIEELIDVTEKAVISAITALEMADSKLKILIPAMHKSIISGDGDFTATNRSEFADVSDPVFAQVQVILQSIARLQGIYSEDFAAYTQNTNEHIATFPESIEEFEKLVS